MTHQPKGRYQKFIVGLRAEVSAREGRMFGMRQPLDGPIFENLEDAQNWCIHAMISHYDRRLGMSDATIEPFKGMVDCGPPPDPARFGTSSGSVNRLGRSAEERNETSLLHRPPGAKTMYKST